MNPISEVYNCDCLEFLRKCEDNLFDLAICDFPYGINANKMGMGGTANNRRTARKMYKEHTEEMKKGRLNSGGGKLKDRLLNQSTFDWDNEIPSQEVFDEVFRVSKNQILWGANYFGNLPASRCWNSLRMCSRQKRPTASHRVRSISSLFFLRTGSIIPEAGNEHQHRPKQEHAREDAKGSHGVAAVEKRSNHNRVQDAPQRAYANGDARRCAAVLQVPR